MGELYKDLSQAVVAGDHEAAKNLINQALSGGATAQTILDRGLFPGMDLVGKRFGEGEMFIPEVLYAARVMQAGMEILRPLMTAQEAAAAGTVIIGTVEGDIHSIGKDLVAIMLQGAGFKVVNLGINVKPQAFVSASREHKADVIAMSALLTTTMPKMRETVNACKEAGIRDQVKIIVGGAPVTDEFVAAIGADGYGSNAVAAVERAKALLGHKPAAVVQEA